MRKVFIVLFICMTLLNMTILPTQANTEDEVMSLSLDEAVEYALENSPLIGIKDTGIDKAKVNIEEAKSTYSRFFRIPMSSDLDTLKIKRGYYKDLAEMGLLIAEKQKEQIMDTIKFTVENNYFNVINSKEKLSIQEGILGYAEENLKNINKKNELGMASELEVMTFETSHLQEQNELNKLQREYEFSLMQFNKSIGLPLDTKVNLTDTIGVKPLEEIDINEKVNEAHENRLEVISAEENFKLNESNFEITSSFYTPNTFRHQQAKFELEEANHQLNDIKQNIELMVRRAHIDMVNAFESISVVQKMIEQSEKAYEVTTMMYEVGMATNNDVVEALNNLREARLLEAQGILGYNLAVKQFEASYGIGIATM